MINKHILENYFKIRDESCMYMNIYNIYFRIV